MSGGLIVSGTPPLAGFRTSQVREPNQWFWRPGYTSSPLDALSGIPRGTVLGPLLFLVYIYDLPSVPRSVPDTRLFTDDRLVYHQTQKQRDAAKLQEDLTALEGKKVADMFKP